MYSALRMLDVRRRGNCRRRRCCRWPPGEPMSSHEARERPGGGRSEGTTRPAERAWRRAMPAPPWCWHAARDGCRKAGVGAPSGAPPCVQRADGSAAQERNRSSRVPGRRRGWRLQPSPRFRPVGIRWNLGASGAAALPGVPRRAGVRVAPGRPRRGPGTRGPRNSCRCRGRSVAPANRADPTAGGVTSVRLSHVIGNRVYARMATDTCQCPRIAAIWLKPQASATGAGEPNAQGARPRGAAGARSAQVARARENAVRQRPLAAAPRARVARARPGGLGAAGERPGPHRVVLPRPRLLRPPPWRWPQWAWFGIRALTGRPARRSPTSAFPGRALTEPSPPGWGTGPCWPCEPGSKTTACIWRAGVRVASLARCWESCHPLEAWVLACTHPAGKSTVKYPLQRLTASAGRLSLAGGSLLRSTSILLPFGRRDVGFTAQRIPLFPRFPHSGRRCFG